MADKSETKYSLFSTLQSRNNSEIYLGKYLQESPGVPVVAQWLTNPTRNHEVVGSVPALAQWVNYPALP